ncbi:MAG: DNA cytosine methyltransferase [Prevotella sp.]|nr:DNA cytosine methyltransferase [Prevotella sp.]
MSFLYNDDINYKAISLFAGAGGCSLGFSQYGVNILAAYDICKEAIDTYNYNFKGGKGHIEDLSVCDFRSVRDSLRLQKNELDLIIGGPPCQGFTTAGRRSEDDSRNQLLTNYVNALKEFYPRWFMMENVEGILTTTNGDFLVNCIQGMISLGYTVYMKKVYMQEFGIPQRRKRVIIVGNREGKSFDFPRPITMASGRIYKNGTETLRNAIADIEEIDIPKINHIRKTESGIRYERICALHEGQTMKDLPKELQHKSFAKRAARRVCDGTPSEKRGGSPSGMKRLIYDEPSLTITGSATSEFIHPTQNRMLTVRECARIQTFPDDFRFFGNDSQQMQQIGNAIPPLFANQMAAQIYKCDQKASKSFPNGLMWYNVTKSSAMSPALVTTCHKLDKMLINKLFSF